MTTETNSKTAIRNFNKPAYAVFVTTGLFFLLRKDFSQATIFLGLALVFDPFDVKVAFNKRPLYQRVWMIVHLMVAFTVFAFMFIKQ
jgi:hypothetical protein